MSFLTRFVIWALIAAGCCSAQTATTGLSGGDEFVGPFASWINVKTTYGAAGDGVTDDTAALQTALNNVGLGHSPVIYLPAGTYKISAQLNISSPRQGISIIGQDPATTTILWAGAYGQEMLYLNGVSYAKISRITWNGSNAALTAIDYSWDGSTTLGGSTYNEDSDEVFENLTYGIRGGALGYEDSEHAILRCKFLNISNAGLSVENYNALDWYIWDSTFTNDYIGVTNNSGGGNFHIYGSLFQSSTHADIEIGHRWFFSIRQNFSQNSNAFMLADATGSASASITLQSNIILDSVYPPIEISNPGPVFLFDNIIRGSNTQFGALVMVQDTSDASPVPGDLVAIGNTFSQGGWYSVPNGGEVIDINNNVVSRNAIAAQAPVMQSALPNYNRTIFDVPAASNDVAIQQAIDSAVALNGQRPVVHMPAGNYSVSNTIVLPVGSDVQLVGDGGSAVGASNLVWTGAASGPLVRMAGPSRATLRDFNIVAGSVGAAVLIQNADQSSGRVFMEQLGAHNLSQYGLFINGLDNASVILHDFYVVSDNIGIQVTGGPNAAAGQSVAAKNDLVAGLTASNNLSYNINSHGRLLAQDVWYEGGPAQLVNLSDSGTFTLHSAHIGAQDAAHGGVASSLPAFGINNFNGSVSLIGAQLDVRNNVGVQGSAGNTNFLALGILGPPDNPNFFYDNASPQGQVALVASRRMTPGSASIAIPDQYIGVNSAASFITNMVAQTRTEQAQPFAVLPAGITDARLYRLSVNGGATGVEVDAAGPASSTAPGISGVASSVNATSASISWATDQTADTQVFYGTTTSYGSSSTLNTSLTTSHSVVLQNLTAGVTYHYVVKSRSQSGYAATSPDQILGNSSSSPSTSLTLVNSFTPGGARNNYNGLLGIAFTTGSTAPVVSSLGRIMISGNTGTHTVKIVNASTGADVAGASVSISMAGGTPGAFKYASLPSSVALAPNTAYYLLTNETSGGDQWYDIGPVNLSAIATPNGAIYSYIAGNFVIAAAGAQAYGPVDFTYQTGVSSTPTPTSPPSVSITSPAAGSALSGSSVAITASASAATGLTIARVQFQIDGANIGSAVSTTPYTTNLNTSSYTSGNHVLTAIATDSSGVTATSASITVSLGSASTSSSATAFISGLSGSSLRNNFSGFVGMQITVGSAPLQVSALGRIFVAGNTGTHTVKFVTASSGADVPGATASISGGTAGQYTYAQLASPVTLAANTAYYLVSQETSQGDQWYDLAPVSPTSVATVNGPIYQTVYVPYTLVGGFPGSSYVPLNFQYGGSGSTTPVTTAATTVTISSPAASASVSGTSVSASATATPGSGLAIVSVQFKIDGANSGAAVSAAPYTVAFDSTKLSNGSHTLTAVALDSSGSSTTSSGVTFTVTNNTATPTTGSAILTGFAAGPLRNNYSGFVGMQFTVGSSPISVTALGRIYVGGNSGVHTVKLVQASNGADVAGSSVSVSVASGTAGLFTYATLASPVSLAANTAYYLVDQETAGGDQWYEITPVTPSAAATVNGPVYSNGYSYFLVGGYPNQSYVPLNFLYSTGSGSVSSAAPSVTITAPASGATVSGPLSITATASAASGLSIAGVQYLLDGSNLGSVHAASPYSQTLDTTTLTNGSHSLSAVATDSAGNSGTSSAVTLTVSNASAPVSSSGSALLSSFTPSTLRSNSTGLLGLKFTVGSTAISVNALGRLYIAGNSAQHAMKLINAATGVDVAGSSVNVSVSSGTAGQFTYVTLASPVTLAANTPYYLVSQETSGGDSWYDSAPATPASVASLNGSVFYSSAFVALGGSSNSSYGPVNLLYGASTATSSPSVTPPSVSITSPAAGASLSGSVSLTASATASTGLTVASVRFSADGVSISNPVTSSPYMATVDTTILTNGSHVLTATAVDSGGNSTTSSGVSVTVSNAGTVAVSTSPLITATGGGTLRNNFSGLVGMRFTTGSAPITVTSLGRMYFSSNTGSHTVKLALAGTGADVAGASVTVALPAGTAGQFSYVALPSPVTLAANTSYYLTSSETAGGDQWYDISGVTGSSAASIDGPAYNPQSAYQFVGGYPGASYVPVSLLYHF